MRHERPDHATWRRLTNAKTRQRGYPSAHRYDLGRKTLSACFQGGRITLASGWTLAREQKIAHPQKPRGCYSGRIVPISNSWISEDEDSSGLRENFTSRVTLQPGNALLHSKVLETIRQLTWTRRLTLPGVFTREKVNPPTRVTLARR